jgi:YYY domain-containing protein
MPLFSTVRAAIRRAPDGVALLLLLVILSMGWSLRTIRLVEWDGDAFLIHPDDYYIGQSITPNLRVPDSFMSYLRTDCPTTVNEQGLQQIVNARNPGDKFEDQRPSANSGCNSLNPRTVNRGHVYGSLPTTLVRYAAEKIYADTDPNQLSRVQILRVGRTASTLADLFALVLVYLMGKLLANRKVGLLAAFLYAWTPFLIQQSHFYAVDTQAAAYGVLTLYFCLRLANGGRWGAAIGAGLGLGLAVSSKINMAPLVLIVILAAMQNRWPSVDHEDDPWSPLSIISRGGLLLWRAMPLLLVAAFTTYATMRLAMPDMFGSPNPLNPLPHKQFLEAIGGASRTSSGELDFPPSHQWAYRANYIFELKNMIVWGMGVPLGLGVWLGWAALGVGMLRRASRALVRWLPLWAWVTFYFGWQGGLMIKPMRYMLPIYAALILFAAWGLIALIAAARRAERPILFRRVPLQAWAISLASMVALVTLLWGWGFSRIYERPHTRIQAAEWARRAIPPGSVVTSDSWDIGIPFLDGGTWPGEQLGITNENDQAAMEEFIQTLDRADYLAFTSNRAYGSLAQLPLRFPAALRYFRAVFDGSLGFEKVADFTSFPSFLGIPFNDELAEESWSVYDHPRVTIWRKTDAWNIDNARRLILDRVNLNELYKLKPIEASPMPTMLQLTPERWLEQQPAGTWSDTFASLTNYLPTVFWLLLIEVIGLATFGLLWRWRLPLPDRGLGMARLAGLIILAFVAWLPPALHLWSFSRLWIGIVAALLVAAGGLALWRSRVEVRAWALDRRRSIITGQLIYLAAFGLLLLIRYLNPDLWHPAMGGEKPMNLAYLTATMKTAEFPPYDPWFAGGYMNYYYWGYVLVGTPMKLLGLRPEIGFNLALPLLYGLTAQVAGSLGYNLLSSLKRAAAPLERRARWVALATAIAVVLLGNLAQVVLYVNGARTVGNPELSFGNPEQSSQGLWLTGGSPLPDALRGFKAVLGAAEMPFRPEWPYWNATRVIPGTINEFPFFSYLYGDLHAHVIALPMTVLALLLLVALWRARSRGRWLRVSLAAALGFLVGALRATNTWDFPTYAALAGVGVLAVALQSSAGRPWRRRWVDLALMLGALGLLMIGPWIPFTRYMGTGSYDKLMLVTSDTRMTWRDFFVIYGLWVAVLVPFGFMLARRIWSWNIALIGVVIIGAWMGFTRMLGGIIQPRDQYVAEGKIGEFINDLILEPLRQNGAGIAIVLPLLVAAVFLLAAALRGRVRRREVLPVAWATAGLALLLLTETVVLPGAGRMNVVFKFSYQAWVLFAVAAATALPTMLSRRTYALTTYVADHFVEGEPGQPARRVRRTWSPLILSWMTVTGLLVLGTLVYPLTATPAKISDRYVPDAPRGLDGMAWMDRATWNENGEFSLGADAAAIRWLRENVAGTPTILEASTSPYRWNAGLATWTGLPTLIGWDGHQNQQRAPARADGIIGYRKTVIQLIYTTVDPGTANRLLDTYGVGVVYIGPLERNLYGPEAGSALVQLGGTWQLAYDQGEAKIYLRNGPPPPPLNLLPLSVKAGVPAPDPVANVTLPVTTGELPPVDGVADWPWLGRNQWAAILLWLLVFELLGLLAWPLAALVFRSHGAAAWGSSKALGLVALGWIVWLPASLGFWRWTRGSVLAGMALLAVLAALAWRMGAAARIRQTLRRQRRELILTELVFIGLFALWTLVRAANPDLWHPYWGGEKPFEAGFLNAVLRSPNMAPVDPFFSGGTINYYYYGLYLVALPMKLLGLDPAIGFNLAVAVVGALIGVGAWSIGLLVLRRARYAALTLVAVALIGNLAGAVPVGTSTGLAGVVRAYQACDLPHDQPRPACDPVESASDVNIGAVLGDALVNGTGEGFSRRLGGGVPWFWGPSRVLVDPPLVTINEFPLWSVIFADLHAHLIALPLTLLVVGLAWEASRRRRWRATWPILAALALVLGALAPSNAWDVPTYGLLVVLALALRGWQARLPALDPAGASLRQRLAGLAPTAGWALAGVGVVLVGVVLYAPFFGAYKAPVGGVWPIRIGSPLLPWLTIYGLFLLIIIGWLMLPARRARRLPAVRWSPEPAVDPDADAELELDELDQADHPESDPPATILAADTQAPATDIRPPTSAPLTSFVRRVRPRWLLPYALLGFALVIWFLVRSEPQTYQAILSASFGVRLLLVALLALLAPRLLRRSREPGSRWAVVLATLGALVALGSEMVFIRDHLAPLTWEGGPNNSERMNTVFKFGYQVWVLWALAAGLLLPRLLRGLRRANAWAYGAWVGVLSLLGAASLAFTIFGPISRAGTRFDQFPAGLTLDGLAFMDTASYGANNGSVQLADDAAAIRWITQNISGTPVLLQSEQEFYRAYGVRIAANTGLPTIVSALHSNEQRPPALVDERVRDVQRIYAGSDPLETQWLLNKYKVDYVYVGTLERLRDPIGVDKFATLAGLRQVYAKGSVAIYQATPDLANLALQWRPEGTPPPPPSTPVTIEPSANDELTTALTKYENDPGNAGNAFDAGIQLWRAGQPERAAAILRTSADQHPGDIGLHHVLGDVLLALGRYEECVLAYQQAFDAGPSPQNKNKLGTGYLAWAMVDSSKLPDTERVLLEAVAMDTTLADPHYQLGETYRLMGDVAKARAEYEEYLRLAPADAMWVQASREQLAKLQ